MLDVCLLGCGGMMPLPYRWLTAMMARCDGSSLLIDCGEGTQIAIKEKGWSFKPIDVICFTHYHGDHISGLPGLLLTMGNADRKEPLTLIGPKGLERVVSALRVIAPELPFPIIYKEIEGAEQTFELNGYRLKAFRVKHNVICYGYTIEIDRAGKFDVQRATEQKIPKEYWKHLQKGETVELDGRILKPEMVLGPPRRGIKLTYCTDTRPTDSIRKNAKGSDLFICEGMYGEKEKAEKVKETIQMAIVKRYPNNAGALALARAVTVKYNIFYTGVALNDTHVSSVNDFIPCSICKVSNDDKIDIAIIQVNTKKTPDGVVNIVDLNDIVTDKELQLGKKVYTIGFPQSFILGDTEIGLEANNQSGEITQQRGEYQYGHNITIHQGASGSPVFNERGKFAGVIVSGYLGLSQGYNQAVQPKRAVELIK